MVKAENLGIALIPPVSQASLVAQMVKNHLQCGKPGFDPWVGKIWRRTATHSNILA